jgi:hypothetical protein
MQRILTIVALVSLLLMASGVALDVNIAQYGALNTRSGGISPQEEAIASGISTAAFLGMLLLFVTAVLGIILAGRRHQWGWLLVFVALAPAAVIAFLQAGFEADVPSGLASLVAPVVYLLYSLEPRRLIRRPAPN